MILVSIAMEELALSHILEAESEKIKYALDCGKHKNCCANLDQVLEINESAARLIETVMDTQIILKKKMESALNALPKQSPTPCPSLCPVPKPEKDCCHISCQPHKHSAIFTAKPFNWCGDRALPLCKQPTSCVGIALSPSGDTQILLPGCSRFVINFNLELELLLSTDDSVSIELRLFSLSKTLVAERYHASSSKNCVTVSGSIIAETPRNDSHVHLCLKLLSPCSVQVAGGRISIMEL